MRRREFIKKGFALAAVGTTAGFSLGSLFGESHRLYFRPPGALAEDDFLAACIRCGKCIQACPYNSLVFADLTDGLHAGTPYFDFRKSPCYMCEDIPCVKICPTDALDHSLVDINNAVIGTAVITDREACLSLNGLRCEICYRACPLIDKAITLKKHEQTITKRHTVFEPVIHKDVCTGCGICENACPLDETAIRVLSSERGDKAGHYIYLKEQV